MSADTLLTVTRLFERTNDKISEATRRQEQKLEAMARLIDVYVTTNNNNATAPGGTTFADAYKKLLQDLKKKPEDCPRPPKPVAAATGNYEVLPLLRRSQVFKVLTSQTQVDLLFSKLKFYHPTVAGTSILQVKQYALNVAHLFRYNI